MTARVLDASTLGALVFGEPAAAAIAARPGRSPVTVLGFHSRNRHASRPEPEGGLRRGSQRRRQAGHPLGPYLEWKHLYLGHERNRHLPGTVHLGLGQFQLDREGLRGPGDCHFSHDHGPSCGHDDSSRAERHPVGDPRRNIAHELPVVPGLER